MIVHKLVDRGSLSPAEARRLAKLPPRDRFKIAGGTLIVIAVREEKDGIRPTEGQERRVSLAVDLLARPQINLDTFVRTVSTPGRPTRSSSGHSTTLSRITTNFK